MKHFLLFPVVLAAGLATGGGAAFGIRTVSPTAAAKPVIDTGFVPAGAILVPLVAADGTLAGYARVDVQLEVETGTIELVSGRLPVLLDAINRRTYKAPLAASSDRLLPDLATFRTLVAAAAVEAYGKGVVRRVAVTSARAA